ncbi:MAG: transcription-repair coupling factor, partial [Anaeromassilibacillus sp.]|nr:transcription-repair coupling factor [Anaeromassilibacillus sp.]
KEYFSDGILCRGFETYSISHGTFDEILSENTCIYLDNFSRGGYDIRLDALVPFTAKQLSPWNGSVTALCDDLEGITLKNKAIVILAGTEKAASNVASLLRDRNYNAVYSTNLEEAEKGIIYVTGGSLSSGFEYPSLNFMLITHSLIPAKPSKKRKTIKSGEAIYSLSELTPGDYVVHSTHGIGIFGGIHKIDTQGIVKDYIKISYAKGDVLYVPVTQLDLVSKYIGPKENSTVKISRLGGTEWQKAKTRVKAAVKDMAKELIALYSARMSAKGHAFSADTEWQKDFEACFEYEETPDQLRCIDEIKGDMEKTAPMDRLLCGDVGFGKTEVALRAAFKCVCDSKQCALLCPTTILAWQHYQTALKRFDGYPIRIELLSRFRTAKQQKDILEKLERGEIDIIIGTHRLVQKDVKFRDPGLVIIDEEQRFGVAQKEKFKEWYKNIDVLTLSATPIPRTLNMAMSGIRDMSVIEEAPQDRQPVQTYVLEHDEAVINEAIRRELRRGGQVFYLHNRVDSIDSLAASIAKRIPEASVGVGHGKMSEHQLSKVWEEMLEQKINVLVCTTIIETGVDLPNANTLIIENADCMGLSQLHQLRGRVGRSSRRAYAYLTFNRSKVLSDISQKRLNAIREFTEFGSGFKIAMRDLELRGAGNILGAKQHGHMEDVGYDMYLKLLGDAVKEEKGEKTTNPEIDCLIDVAVQAHIPESYISDLSTRLDAYRRIADIRNDEDAHDVTDEFIDRFGEPPQSVVGLIDIALIRNMANAFGIYEIRQNDSGFLLYLRNIKSEEAMDIVVKNAGKAFLNAGKKPYILIKASKSEKPLEFLLEIFTNLKK